MRYADEKDRVEWLSRLYAKFVLWFPDPKNWICKAWGVRDSRSKQNSFPEDEESILEETRILFPRS